MSRSLRSAVAPIAALAVSLVAPLSAGAFSFSAQSLNVGGTAVAADLDGDGIPDVAAAGSGGRFWVAKGVGTRAAPGPLYFPATYFPEYATGMTAADFDGDGLADLALTGGTGLRVSRTLGATQISGLDPLIAMQEPMTGISPAAGANPVAGDFDGDGHEDVAAATTGGILVALGNGDGTFAPPLIEPLAGSTAVSSLAASDVDGDGLADIVVAEPSEHRVQVLRTGNDGLFQPATALTVPGVPVGSKTSPSQKEPSYPAAVSVADLNGDGHGDIVVADGGSAWITVFMGVGNGAFGGPRSFRGGVGPLGLAIADFDHDGRLDIATANCGCRTLVGVHGLPTPPTGQAGVTLFPGNGDGTFGAPTALIDGNDSWATSIVAADLDGDGSRDLVVGHYGGADVVLWNNQPRFHQIFGVL